MNVNKSIIPTNERQRTIFCPLCGSTEILGEWTWQLETDAGSTEVYRPEMSFAGQCLKCRAEFSSWIKHHSLFPDYKESLTYVKQPDITLGHKPEERKGLELK